MPLALRFRTPVSLSVSDRVYDVICDIVVVWCCF